VKNGKYSVTQISSDLIYASEC